MGRWGKVDISGLKQLQKQLENAQKTVDKMMLETANVIANEFLKEVIQRTPQGSSGKLKKNWKAHVIKSGTGYNILVENDLPYASYVEFGKRVEGGGWKQGYFMLHITEQDIERKMNNMAEPIIQKYLGGIFQ